MELLHLLVALVDLIRSDLRVGIALAVLVLAGAVVALFLRRTRRAQFPTLR